MKFTFPHGLSKQSLIDLGESETRTRKFALPITMSDSCKEISDHPDGSASFRQALSGGSGTKFNNR